MWGELGHTGAWQGEILDRRKNGEIYPKWLSISAVHDSSGQVTHYIAHHTELSQRKKDEAALMAKNAELLRSRRELRQLAAQNEHKLEEERRHIAREVHDELGQSLTALRIGMTLLGKRYAQNSPAIVKDIQNLKVLVDRGIQGVRNVATNLRPAALDMGLVPAIQWLCSDFTEHNAIPCELYLHEDYIELDNAKSVAIFRIVQEALTNISRYARATRVDINLGLDGQTLGVEIRDDGCGFNVSISNSKSYGLIGMRERALALRGRIDFVSRPGQGTVIGVSIPLDTEHDEMGGT
jgi:signal transduction histidine kinase